MYTSIPLANTRLHAWLVASVHPCAVHVYACASCIHACMHDCMHTCMHFRTRPSMSGSMHVWIHACLDPSMSGSMHACPYAHMHLRIHPCVCIHACMPVSIHPCLRPSIHVCIYISKRIHTCLHTCMYVHAHAFMYVRSVLPVLVSRASPICACPREIAIVQAAEPPTPLSSTEYASATES